MNRKWASGVVILLVFLGIGSATVTIAYPFSYDDYDDGFDRGAPEEPYSARGTVLVDGDVLVEYESAVSTDSEAAATTLRMYYNNQRDGRRIFESYWDGDHVHRRVQTDDPMILNDFVETDGVVNATVDEASNEAVRVVGQNDPILQDTRDSMYGFILRHLEPTTYDHVETRTVDGVTVDVYEPGNGWYDGQTKYRVTNASGVVHIDSETGRLRYANVTLDRTRAANYLDYLRNRDNTETVTILYDRSAPPEEVKRPGWTIKAE